MSATKNTLSNFVTKLAVYPIGFISSVIVARILGPEDRGIYTYLLLLTSFLLPILTFGIGGGITYYISSKENKPDAVFVTVFLTSIFFGFLITGIIFILWYFQKLGATGNRIQLLDLLLLLGAVVSNTVFFFVSRMLTGDSKFTALNWLTIAQGLINPVLLLILVWIFGLGLHGASASLFAINTIICIASLVFAVRSYNLYFGLDLQFIKKSFRYGIKGWLGDMAVRANLRLDQILLGAAVSASALGIYSVAVMLVELIWIIPDAIGPVLFNKIAAEKDINERINLTNKINRILIGLSVVIGVLLFIGTYFIILPYGYGKAYDGVVMPLLLMIPGSILFIIAKVITKLLSGSGKIGATSTAMVIGSLMTILFYFLLIPRYGLIGAALGSSLGYISVSLACIYQYNKHFGIQIKNLFAITLADIHWLKTIATPFTSKLKQPV